MMMKLYESSQLSIISLQQYEKKNWTRVKEKKKKDGENVIKEA